MANITFEKGNSRHKHFKQADIKKLIQITLKHLVSTRMNNSLNIKVVLKRDLGDAVGSCNILYRGSKAQRDFTIKLDVSKNSNLLIDTICHELTHVKQIAYNEFQARRWKSTGKVVYRWKGENVTVNNYWSPWENDARLTAHKIGGKVASEYLSA